jgi:hypothetical protein
MNQVKLLGRNECFVLAFVLAFVVIDLVEKALSEAPFVWQKRCTVRLLRVGVASPGQRHIRGRTGRVREEHLLPLPRVPNPTEIYCRRTAQKIPLTAQYTLQQSSACYFPTKS